MQESSHKKIIIDIDKTLMTIIYMNQKLQSFSDKVLELQNKINLPNCAKSC
jgi:hypothetical protein